MIIQHIYSKSALFKKGNPKIVLYYITTGTWVGDAKLMTRIDTEKDTLLKMNIFDEAIFNPVGARELKRLFSRARDTLSCEIEFPNKTALPTAPGITDAYIGHIAVREYIKLIADESGNIIKSLFQDNVRDFQGENPVNKEIADTLKSADSILLPMMNNGITIVSERAQPTGNKFKL